MPIRRFLKTTKTIKTKLFLERYRKFDKIQTITNPVKTKS